MRDMPPVPGTNQAAIFMAAISPASIFSATLLHRWQIAGAKRDRNVDSQAGNGIARSPDDGGGSR